MNKDKKSQAEEIVLQKKEGPGIRSSGEVLERTSLKLFSRSDLCLQLNRLPGKC